MKLEQRSFNQVVSITENYSWVTICACARINFCFIMVCISLAVAYVVQAINAQIFSNTM